MSGEAMDRRKVWEPSVYYSLGKESFHFAGHDISIRESMDTFGALIWPGVSSAAALLSDSIPAPVCSSSIEEGVVVLMMGMVLFYVVSSFVPVPGEQPATSESHG